MKKEELKLGRYVVDGRTVVGRPTGDAIEIVSERDELALALANLANLQGTGRRCMAADATLLPPIDPAARIFAVAINYREHGAEAKRQPPVRPLIFYKAPSNFVAHGGVLNANRKISSRFDYEGEIAVVIGQTCKDVAVEDALSVVAGVCAFNDGTARDLGKLSLGNGPDAATWPDWTAAKSLDGASAMGPTITCGDTIVEALRARSLRIITRLNGQEVQNGQMDQMIFSTEQLIATLSSYMTLRPGDVIATGTPAGVGMARNRLLESGDALEFEVSGLDALKVTVG